MTIAPSLPLAGRRVLVTRAVGDGERWEEALVSRGAAVDLYPCVRRERINDPGTLSRLALAIARADWIVVTSQFGVMALVESRVTIPESVRFAAVAPSTASAVLTMIGRQAMTSRGGTAASLAKELGAVIAAERRDCDIVIVGAAEGRDEVEGLAGDGVRVTRIDVYRTIAADAVTPRRDLAADGVTDVLLASPSAVTGVMNLAVIGNGTRVYTIGPTTSAAARAAGLVVAGESATRDLTGLMEAMQCVTGT